MSKTFEDIRHRIETNKYENTIEARFEITANLVHGNISNAEHSKLREILNNSCLN